MNRVILAILGALMLASQASGASLDELINQNVRDATSAYENTIPLPQQPAKPARLWVHIRGASQTGLAQNILHRMVAHTFDHWHVKAEEIRRVNAGPKTSQLRYFKKQDRAQAQELYKALHSMIPKLTLKDFSAEYGSIGWIKPGHYELWLSPKISSLRPPQHSQR